ncbi:MAG: hypothetical protein AAF086_01210 [Planctomycetota bacterium]
MTFIQPNNVTKLLATTAVLAAILFAVGQADAGTQMPYWKKMQLLNQPTADLSGPATTNDSDKIAVVDEMDPPVKSDDGGNGQTPSDSWDDGMSGGNGGSTPAAAPTPSAVLGGIAMIGMIAARRRRQEDA